MRLTAIAGDAEGTFDPSLREAIDSYESRDAERVIKWNQAFGPGAEIRDFSGLG